MLVLLFVVSLRLAYGLTTCTLTRHLVPFRIGRVFALMCRAKLSVI